jgi:WD40 repeat protein
MLNKGEDRIKSSAAPTRKEAKGGILSQNICRHNGGKEFQDERKAMIFIPCGSGKKIVSLKPGIPGEGIMNRLMHSFQKRAIVTWGITVLMAGWSIPLSNTVYAAEKPEIFVQLGHTERVHTVAFSPRGDLLMSTSTGKVEKKQLIGTIAKIWDVKTGRELISFVPETNSVSGAEFADFSPDGSRVVVLHMRDLAVVDLSTGKQRIIDLRSLGTIRFQAAAISPDNRTVSILSDEETLHIFDIASGMKLSTIRRGKDSYLLRLSPGSKYYMNYDGTYLANTAWVSDLASGERLMKINIKEPRPIGSYAAFSKDGRRAVFGLSSIVFWDFLSGQGRKLKTEGELLFPFPVSISPDGRYFLTITKGKGDNPVSIYDASTAVIIKKIEGYKFSSAMFHPDGQHIITGDEKGHVVLWDILTGKETMAFRSNHHIQFFVAKHFDRYLVTSVPPKGLVIWDIHAATLVKGLNKEMGEEEILSYVNKKSIKKEGSKESVLVGFSGESADGKLNAKLFDGTVKLFESKTNKEIAQFISFTDGEWIVITPGGYFNASANGAKYLNVRMGKSVYAIEQFYSNFYRPELVKLALAGEELPKGESLTDVLAKKPAPSVQIMSPHSGTVDQDMIKLSVKATDNGGGIGSINIYLNGSQVANDTRSVMVKGKEAADEKILTFSIPLIQGPNEIRAIAFNNEGSMESSPAIINIFSKANLQKPDLYAIVVGINEYRNKSISLTYAIPDAKAFAETLKKSAVPLFEKIQIKLLTTFDETTRESITNAFEEMRGKIKPNDLFVFYNASHGIVDVSDEEEQYFLLTSNVLLLSSRHIKKDAMSQKELAKLVGNIPAQKKLIILDTCNAGKGGKEIQAALLQQTRGLTESTAVKILQRAIGSAVFSASSDTQQALEGYRGHGLFTYVLIEGLQGKADIKKEGFITIYGLADFVEEQVVKLSEEVFKRQQTPTIQTGANFPIGRIH